jgi:lipoyl-dependent peroxiredoxin
VTAEIGIVGLGDEPPADAEKVVEAAHQVCPYSNATRGNVDVKLQVETA